MTKILLTVPLTCALWIAPAGAASVANLWLPLPETATDATAQIRVALQLDEMCQRDLGGTLDKATLEVVTRWAVPTLMLGRCVLPTRAP